MEAIYYFLNFDSNLILNQRFESLKLYNFHLLDIQTSFCYSRFNIDSINEIVDPVDYHRHDDRIKSFECILFRLLKRIEWCCICCLKLGVTFGCWLHVYILMRMRVLTHTQANVSTEQTYRWWVDKHRSIVQSTAYLVSLCRQFGR